MELQFVDQLLPQIDGLLKSASVFLVKAKDGSRTEKLMELSQLTNNDKVAEIASVSLAQATSIPANVSMIQGNPTLFNAYVTLVKSSNPVVVKFSAFAWSYITENPAAVDNLPDQVITEFVNAIKTSKDPQTIENYLRSCGFIAKNDTKRSVLVNAGILDIALTYITDAAAADINVADIIANAKVVTGLVSLLGSKKLPFREDSLRTLIQLTKSDKGRDTIFGNNGVAYTIAQLKMKQDTLVGLALTLLSNMTYHKPARDFLLKYLDTELMPLLSSTSDDTVSKTVMLLAYLAREESDITAVCKALPMTEVVKLLKAKKSMKVNEQLLSLLGSILSNGETHHQLLELPGTLELFREILESNSWTLGSKVQVGRAMTQLTLYYDDIRTRVASSGVTSILLSLLQSLLAQPKTNPEADQAFMELHLHICNTFVNLSLSASNVHLILTTHGALQFLSNTAFGSLPATFSGEQAQSLQVMYGKILTNLTTHANIRAAMQPNIQKVLENILALLAGKHPQIQLQGAKLLTNVAFEGRVRKLIHTSFKKVLEAAQTSIKVTQSEEVKYQLMTAISNLAYPYDDHYADEKVAKESLQNLDDIVRIENEKQDLIEMMQKMQDELKFIEQEQQELLGAERPDQVTPKPAEQPKPEPAKPPVKETTPAPTPTTTTPAPVKTTTTPTTTPTPVATKTTTPPKTTPTATTTPVPVKTPTTTTPAPAPVKTTTPTTTPVKTTTTPTTATKPTQTPATQPAQSNDNQPPQNLQDRMKAFQGQGTVPQKTSTPTKQTTPPPVTQTPAPTTESTPQPTQTSTIPKPTPKQEPIPTPQPAPETQTPTATQTPPANQTTAQPAQSVGWAAAQPETRGRDTSMPSPLAVAGNRKTASAEDLSKARSRTMAQKANMMQALQKKDEELQKLKAEQEKLQQKAQQSHPASAPGVDDQMSKKRTMIVQELVATEKSYVNSLDVMIKKFQIPMSCHPLVKPDQIKSIFSNIQVIHNYNSLLLDSLSNRLISWGPTQLIGDVMMKSIESFHFYTEYVTNFNNASNVLAQIRTNSQVEDLVQKLESDPQCAGLDLPSFLIMPVQRIPRYNLLLADLIKNTPENHPDHKNLVLALDKTKALAATINETQREMERSSALLSIQSKFKGETILVPNRRLLREGSVQVYRAKSHKTREGGLYVFTDCIMVAKKKKNLMKLLHKMPLPGTKATVFVDSGSYDGPDAEFAFTIFGGNDTVVCVTSSRVEKHEWVEAINYMRETPRKVRSLYL